MKQESLYRYSQRVSNRVKYEEDGEWVFVCHQCWDQISQDNPFYVYGGTWKARKK